MADTYSFLITCSCHLEMQTKHFKVVFIVEREWLSFKLSDLMNTHTPLYRMKYSTGGDTVS